MNNIEEKLPEWSRDLNCAITVCDADCRIIYMNDLSRKTFARHGDIIGHNLLDYHPSAPAPLYAAFSRPAERTATLSRRGRSER